MDIVRAKRVVSLLAEGIDPTTGEILPDDSVCNKGDVVRALYAVLKSLGADKTKEHLPENAGKPWTKEDDALLAELYQSGSSKESICQTFKRTESGVASRLVRLGIIKNRDIFRTRK